MTLLAALAVLVAPTLLVQAPPMQESVAPTLAQESVASDDADQKCFIILGTQICF